MRTKSLEAMFGVMMMDDVDIELLNLGAQKKTFLLSPYGGMALDAKVGTHSGEDGGGRLTPFFIAVYIDDYPEARVQHFDDDMTALISSASLGSDHVRLFGPGEVGV